MTRKQAAGFGFKMLDEDWFMRDFEGMTFMIGPTNEDFPPGGRRVGLWVSLGDVLSYYMIGRAMDIYAGLQGLMVKARVFARRIEDQEWATQEEVIDFLSSENRFFEGEMTQKKGERYGTTSE